MSQLNDPDLFRQQCYINGQWLNADNGAVLSVSNPATGQPLGSVPNMGATEAERAIAAAQAALAGWRAQTAKQRSQLAVAIHLAGLPKKVAMNVFGVSKFLPH